jgi:hypothetical protein
MEGELPDDGPGGATGALASLDAAITDLLAVRYPALSGRQVRDAIAGLYRAEARLRAATYRAVAAVDERDDVVPRARAGTAAASLLRYGLGLDPRRARSDSTGAQLLSPDTGDLAQVGAALAAGEIHPGHADVAVRVHTQLGAGVRGRVDPSTGQVCVDVVGGVLAAQARAASVAELDRFGRRLVEQLNPVSPDGAHQRRYRYLSPLPDGSLLGKFACGPAQAALLRAAVTAGAAPRPGVGIDADGVRHDLPDERTAAQRRMDALSEIVTADLARGGITLPDTLPDTLADTLADTLDSVATDQPAEATDDEGLVADPPEHADLGQSVGADVGTGIGDLHEPPEPEGREQVLRPPGVVTGPYPDVEIVVVATLDHLAAVAAGAANQPIGPSAGKLFDLGPPPAGRSQPDHLQSLREPGGPPGDACDGDGEAVHPDTLRLLACSAALRRVLLTPSGAVLDLGRSVRLATPAQRRALLARDGGCVIPGCLVPAASCDAHHVVFWTDQGPTDLDNLALLCSRHHTETHEPAGWQIEMIDGVPWVRPPARIDPRRRPLRNIAHRTAA